MDDPTLQQLFADLSSVSPPAAHPTWQPKTLRDIGLRIKADGTWEHQNAPISRRRMVKFFASLLRRETDGAYVLITPYVKYPVSVDEQPFHAVELRRHGRGKTQTLIFRTNLDEVIRADREHPIRVVTNGEQQLVPTIEVRANLRAKLSRAVYYELAQFAQPRSSQTPTLGVYSDGVFFALQ